ncbi:ROK family protein [Brevibacillus centrosporus]|uniref:Sugar kinase of the NBD/HSP70 family, may contain an N-terminal HTH domain n=1 Tax=Brevibacillus centrosporus TaxID=54910 RepID=A0A1I4E7L2_9BACL|nr:ROK family protein [Brevibacillus centrosporus]SFL00161.1 Sugar kinase of the NBD/HSP70 family, may contain an N-terminal HTH domain [Brevibacillus centrosporus]
MHNCPFPDLIYAIDIGGTKIDCIRVFNGELTHYQMNTPNSGFYNEDFKLLREWVANFLIAGEGKVVVSFPGLVKEDVIIKWPNKAYWEGYSLREDLCKIFTTCKVEIYEDCNMGAFVNYLIFNEKKHSLYINIGTGIGCGILLDGKLFTGAQGYAGEFGHTIVQPDSIIQCTCGKRGCLQLYSSGRGMIQRLQEKSKLYQAVSSLEEFSSDSLGDTFVKETILEGAKLFGVALSNFISIFDVTDIHFGGSVLHNQLFRETFIQTAHEIECEFLQRELHFIINPFFNSSLIGALLKAANYDKLPNERRTFFNDSLKKFRSVNYQRLVL